MMESQELFMTNQFFDVVERHEEAALREIDSINGNDLLATNPDALIDYIVKNHRMDAPVLREDNLYLVHNETDVPVGGRPIVMARGTAFEFHVRFDGHAPFFFVRPSNHYTSHPRGSVTDSELVLTYHTVPGAPIADPEQMKRQFHSDLNIIRGLLATLQQGVDAYHNELRRMATERIQTRREKLLRDRNLAESLGVPIRRRDGLPTTFVHPGVRRKPEVRRPPAERGGYQPEPILEFAEYEHILSVIGDMATVMERSPSAFAGMDEEALRFMFLVPLNGHYESATGETFNFQGKTDLLIRADGKNIFLAECKFWDGPQSLTETIDQLLGYTSWRDTKTAIIIFNRNRNLTRVLEQIPGLLAAHPNFRRMYDYPSETGFRCALHHRDDPARELTLTVLVFDVPAPEE
jgi:hypothetical protein